MKLIFFIALMAFAVYLLVRRKKQALHQAPDGSAMHLLLVEHVSFYQKLGQEEQQVFLKRVQDFLHSVAITPVKGLALTDLDRLYIASSAIIPIFHFKDWRYNNLNEVLVYSDAFDHDYSTTATGRNITGMVGTGAMNRMMILSIQAIRAGFEHSGIHNTGIHEFVHLLDKADGATDGIPEYMIPKALLKPWISHMHASIQAIRSGRSDIDTYAGTNEAEFFAVLSEYFFQKPHLLQEHHPYIFKILKEIYEPGN